RDFVLAINKMDLVDFDRVVYDGIRDDFEEILAGARAHAIPCSALHGDNVITRSSRTPWFDGPSLLEYLETVQVTRDLTALPFRFPVQLVLNQIGTVNISTARPLVFDRYTENRATGSFIIIDPATHFTAGAGMISNPLHHPVKPVNAPISAAERLALLARHAGSDAEAVEAIRKALEEL